MIDTEPGLRLKPFDEDLYMAKHRDSMTSSMNSRLGGAIVFSLLSQQTFGMIIRRIAVASSPFD